VKYSAVLQDDRDFASVLRTLMVLLLCYDQRCPGSGNGRLSPKSEDMVIVGCPISSMMDSIKS